MCGALLYRAPCFNRPRARGLQGISDGCLVLEKRIQIVLPTADGQLLIILPAADDQLKIILPYYPQFLAALALLFWYLRWLFSVFFKRFRILG